MSPLIYVLIPLTLVFDFFNGVQNSTIVSTMISSRAMPPKLALMMTALAEFVGPFIFGVAVAKTIGNEIVSSSNLNMHMLIAAILSALLWSLITSVLGIPSSPSHALIGGLIGAAAIGVGFQDIYMSGVTKVLVALFASPIIGFVVAVIITNIIYVASWKATPNVNTLFKWLQIFTSLTLSLSTGANDPQKSMGIITLGLIVAGAQKDFNVPFWVMLISALGLAAGTAAGGWRLIRTVSSKFFKIRPVHGFAAQATSAAVVLTASLLGGPVSSTQVMSSAIMGVGAADRINKVRWNVAGDIITAWFLTIPATALVAAGIYWLMVDGFPLLSNFFK